MSLEDRVTVKDWKLLEKIGHAIWVGRGFAFVGVDAGRDLPPKQRAEWQQQSESGPWIVPLVGQGEVPLPGGTVRGVDVSRLRLASVTTDKALYQEGRDEVCVFACDLAARGAERQLRILAHGGDFRRRIVALDDYGCAAFAMRDLPAGEYQLRWQEDDDQDPGCSFTVAEYRLVPLVASLLERRVVPGEPPQLAMTLRLESFAVPVDGPVRLELLDCGIRVAEQRAEVQQGTLDCCFELVGEGPHALTIQMESNPSQTATIPILGSRQEERSLTVFSKLGPIVVGSLLPGDNSHEVHGLHLEQVGTESAPLHLRRVDTAAACLDVKTEAAPICVAIVNLPEGGEAVPTRLIHREAVAAGETVEIPIPGPMSLIAVGAFVNGKPWEGWAALLPPSQLHPRICLPASAAPNERVDIAVEVEGATEGEVYLVVKDARLPSTDSPGNQLARQMKRTVERSPIVRGKPHELLRAVLSARRAEPEGLELTGLVGYTAALMPSAALESAGGIYETAALAAGSDSAGDADAETELGQSDPPGEVVFAGLLPVRDQRAHVGVTLGRVYAEYLVEAFVCSGSDWASQETRFQATKDPCADLQMPAFVHPHDGALATLHAAAASGRLQVELTRNQNPVPLLLGGEAVDPDLPLETPRAQLTFLATPGEYQAAVKDLATGKVDRITANVDVPGKLQTTARSVRFLQPPGKLTLTEDATYRSLRVLPGLDKPFRVLVEATSGYAHLCCEQTAAKMLAASAMFALAEDDLSRRDRAEAILIAGAEREREMWLPGRGLKMYPESPNEPDAFWGRQAAHHLHYLDLLRNGGGNGFSRPLQNAVDLSCEIARDVSRAYDLDWPPRQPRNCAEAYALLRFGKEDSARQRAIDWVRQHLRDGEFRPRVEEGVLRGKVALRAESAYAAAALFRGGNLGDLSKALQLANDVVAALGEEGRLYSTVDSVAAVALLAEMRAARIVGSQGTVVIDGQILSAQEAALVQDASEIEAREGTVAVEILRTIEDDWDRYAGQVPLRVTLEQGSCASTSLNVGEAVDLVVNLTDGYSAGDLLWVCLPHALSRVVGGGQVKRFALDFQGRDELRVPLVATSSTVDRAGEPAPNRFGVCVRNMFEEERAGSPGLLEVTVRARGS